MNFAGWLFYGGGRSLVLFSFINMHVYTHTRAHSRSHAHTLAQPLHSTQGVSSTSPVVYFHFSLFIEQSYAPLTMH